MTKLTNRLNVMNAVAKGNRTLSEKDKKALSRVALQCFLQEIEELEYRARVHGLPLTLWALGQAAAICKGEIADDFIKTRRLIDK